MKTPETISQISQMLRMIDHPARLQLLLAIDEEEACVCHLQALFGWRQAYISQHLNAMRRAGVLHARRRGRFVYYRLADERLLALIQLTAEIAGGSLEHTETLASAAIDTCKCPSCQLEALEPAISVIL